MFGQTPVAYVGASNTAAVRIARSLVASHFREQSQFCEELLEFVVHLSIHYPWVAIQFQSVHCAPIHSGQCALGQCAQIAVLQVQIAQFQGCRFAKGIRVEML